MYLHSFSKLKSKKNSDAQTGPCVPHRESVKVPTPFIKIQALDLEQRDNREV